MSLLLACGGDPGGPDYWSSEVTGLVLTYADATRSTTVPIPGATLDVLLPEGQTRQFCIGTFGVSCQDVPWVNRSYTDTEGRYSILLEDPAYCGLRVRAYGETLLLTDTAGAMTKTATAPQLATACEDGGSQQGPTLVLE